LLVITPDERIATWARQPIEIGHPGFRLVPIVVSYAMTPRVTDPRLAIAAPELALISAMGHMEVEMAAAVAAALDRLPEDMRKLYLAYLKAAWPPDACRRLEEHMNISPQA